MNLPLPPGLTSLVLGPAGHRRVRASQALLALVVCSVFALVQQAEVELGLIDRYESNLLTLFNLSGSSRASCSCAPDSARHCATRR